MDVAHEETVMTPEALVVTDGVTVLPEVTPVTVGALPLLTPKVNVAVGLAEDERLQVRPRVLTVPFAILSAPFVNVTVVVVETVLTTW
jgi:hypothetical protein